ncbi:unnamed protein product, partial [Mesorhabditis spiculigera]
MEAEREAKLEPEPEPEPQPEPEAQSSRKRTYSEIGENRDSLALLDQLFALPKFEDLVPTENWALGPATTSMADYPDLDAESIWHLTERDAIMFFVSRGLIQVGRCADPSHPPMKLTSKSKGAYRWECWRCLDSSTCGVRRDNWFQSTRIQFAVALKLIFYWAHGEQKTVNMREELKVSNRTVIEWKNHLREVCTAKILKERGSGQQLGGPGMTVEVAVITTRQASSRAVEQLLFGAICRENKTNFATIVPDRKTSTLLPLIRENIAAGSRIIGKDLAHGQKFILDDEYEFKVVGEQSGSGRPNTGAPETVGRMWEKFEESFRNRHGTSEKYLDGYICEELWRLRLDGADPFEAILADIKEFWPPGIPASVLAMMRATAPDF